MQATLFYPPVSVTMNPWETSALQYQYQEHQDDGATVSQEVVASTQRSSVSDPLIYPGLYCPSGLDMMSILLRVISRPNPVIDLGPIDASCALILCDLDQPDNPIVYASESFLELTGYSSTEVMGKNCRFLQAPGGRVRASSARQHVSQETLHKMKRAIQRNAEIQIDVTNFKKNGDPFLNALAMIPVRWDSQEFRYSVGFQADRAAYE